jgi:ankyrin repeat protein
MNIQSQQETINSVNQNLHNDSKINKRDYLGRTQLFCASNVGDIEKVKELLENCALVDTYTLSRHSALYIAREMDIQK